MRAGDARECSRRRPVGEFALRPVEVELRQHEKVCTLFRGGSRQPIEAGKRLRRAKRDVRIKATFVPKGAKKAKIAYSAKPAGKR